MGVLQQDHLNYASFENPQQPSIAVVTMHPGLATSHPELLTYHVLSPLGHAMGRTGGTGI